MYERAVSIVMAVKIALPPKGRPKGNMARKRLRDVTAGKFRHRIKLDV
jgi:hypothetical protein